MDDIPLNLGELAKHALREALRERGHVNILIAGRTGVGKSTLINAVFQGNLATTGQGRPVTPSTREITKEDVPLSIFDTRGLELAKFSETSRELERFIADRCGDRDSNKHIHVCWVCIAEDLRRVEGAESRLVEMLAEPAPVVGIITKARADQGFRATVQGLLPKARNVVRVLALAEVLDGGHTLPPTGLQELVSLTMELVPEGCRRALTAAQKVDLALKRRWAHRIVAASAASAGALAAIPIPLADAAMLVPVQVGMIAGITATYGLAFSDGFLSAVLASTVPGTGATIAGRSIVAALFKLIPGPGTLVGIAISATTAVVVTTAFGEAYIRALEALFVRHGGEPAGEQEVLAAVKRYFTGGGGEPPGEQKGPAPLARQFTGGGHGREDRRWYQLWK